MNKTEALTTIARELDRATDSPLYEYRQQQRSKSVPGQGNSDAVIMFIGEAPGHNEARQGRAFVGAAGKLLDELLSHVNIRRDDVFITNIVKDRPPENRSPKKGEIAFYAPFMDRQIDIIRPTVIVTLGRFAMEYILAKFDLLESDTKITRIHGQAIQAEAEYGPIVIVPLYHPAAALYDESKRSVLFEDFENLAEIVRSSG